MGAIIGIIFAVLAIYLLIKVVGFLFKLVAVILLIAAIVFVYGWLKNRMRGR